MNIHILQSKEWEHLSQKGMSSEEVYTTIRAATEEATPLLPPLSPYVNISVYPTREGLIKETGDMGFTYDEERIEILFDPTLPYGVEKHKEHLRATTFHELNHTARSLVIPYDPSPLSDMVSEGTATVFERDFANGSPLWGLYEDEATMRQWLKEIKALPTNEKNYEYLFDHPDGRRWIIYKTGTWVIDHLIKSEQATLNELTLMPVEQVIDLIA